MSVVRFIERLRSLKIRLLFNSSMINVIIDAEKNAHKYIFATKRCFFMN